MSNKRRVMVSLYHRDELSLEQNRQQFGSGAYHWSLLLVPKKHTGNDCYAYDVTDGSKIDLVRRVDLNQDSGWRFVRKERVDPTKSSRLLGMIMIGKVPNDVEEARIYHILQSVPIPRNDRNPRQTCVWGTKMAVGVLQENGLAETTFSPTQLEDLAWNMPMNGWQH